MTGAIRLNIPPDCQLCGASCLGSDAYMVQLPGATKVTGPYCFDCMRTIAAANPPQAKALEHPGRQEAL